MTEGTKAPSDYEVGRGKPPKHTRFEKGRSGNPSGRPAKPRNLKTDLTSELRAKIRVREGDREISISKQEAFIKSLVARALKGDARSASLLIQLLSKVILADEGAPNPDEGILTENEAAILESNLSRKLDERTNDAHEIGVEK